MPAHTIRQLTWLGALWLSAQWAVAAEPFPFTEIAPTGEVEFQPTELETQVPERFRLRVEPFPYQVGESKAEGIVRVTPITFPSAVTSELEQNNTVYGEYFQPTGEGPFPGVVVLHILGGDFELSRTIARALARKKIAALFVKMPYYGERRGNKRRMISREPAETLEGMTQGVLDIRRAAAWLGARPEVDENRLGVQGISLGGIMSALSAAAEPRFKRVAIHLAGGHLAKMLWEKDVPEAAAFREEWESRGGTQESFETLLAPIDPATNAHLLKGRKVLMVCAERDEIFSTASMTGLWEAIGKEPELVWLKDAGHYTAALYIFREITRLQDFFNAAE